MEKFIAHFVPWADHSYTKPNKNFLDSKKEPAFSGLNQYQVEKMTTRTITLPEELVEQIEDFAALYRIDPADFVRLSVQKFVAKPQTYSKEDVKDLLLDDPQALKAMYHEAKEEDRELSQLGLAHYNQLLKQEEENYL